MVDVKPVLFVDIDGVMADSHEWWIARYNTDNGTQWVKEDFTEWNTMKQHGVDLSSYFDDYSGVLPVQGAFTCVAKLSDCYRVVFATAGFGEEWLRSYVGDVEVIRVQDKSLLRGFALIDDRPANLDVFQGERFLLRQPWNTGRGLNDSTWPVITYHLMEVAHEVFGIAR